MNQKESLAHFLSIFIPYANALQPLIADLEYLGRVEQEVGMAERRIAAMQGREAEVKARLDAANADVARAEEQHTDAVDAATKIISDAMAKAQEEVSKLRLQASNHIEAANGEYNRLHEQIQEAKDELIKLNASKDLIQSEIEALRNRLG